MASKKIVLPSKAVLEIFPSDFAVARTLYQAVLEETKGHKMDPSAEVDTNLLKDLFCTMLSSKKVEAAVEACMAKCTYNGHRIESVSTVFDPVEARQDYLMACYEVAVENISPFMKSLYAKFSTVLEKLKPAFPA